MNEFQTSTIKVKPKFVAQKCPNCNGFGTCGFDRHPCPSCKGAGVLYIPAEIEEEGKNAR